MKAITILNRLAFALSGKQFVTSSAKNPQLSVYHTPIWRPPVCGPRRPQINRAMPVTRPSILQITPKLASRVGGARRVRRRRYFRIPPQTGQYGPPYGDVLPDLIELSGPRCLEYAHGQVVGSYQSENCGRSVPPRLLGAGRACRSAPARQARLLLSRVCSASPSSTSMFRLNLRVSVRAELEPTHVVWWGAPTFGHI